jgi:hypothetical protein
VRRDGNQETGYGAECGDHAVRHTFEPLPNLTGGLEMPQVTKYVE